MLKRLGIIGCGQLSQMLGEAANRLDYAVCYMCVDETPVVAGLGPIFLSNAMRLRLSERVCQTTCCVVPLR